MVNPKDRKTDAESRKNMSAFLKKKYTKQMRIDEKRREAERVASYRGKHRQAKKGIIDSATKKQDKGKAVTGHKEETVEIKNEETPVIETGDTYHEIKFPTTEKKEYNTLLDQFMQRKHPGFKPAKKERERVKVEVSFKEKKLPERVKEEEKPVVKEEEKPTEKEPEIVEVKEEEQIMEETKEGEEKEDLRAVMMESLKKNSADEEKASTPRGKGKAQKVDEAITMAEKVYTGTRKVTGCTIDYGCDVATGTVQLGATIVGGSFRVLGLGLLGVVRVAGIGCRGTYSAAKGIGRVTFCRGEV